MEDNRLTPDLPDGIDRGEADALEATWQALGAIEAPEPPADRMRARLDAVIDAFEDASASTRASVDTSQAKVVPFMRRRVMIYALQAAAAAALVGIGVLIGHHHMEATTDASSAEITAMRSEVHDLREMVSLSLMQQQSASERIKGVSWTDRIDHPSDEIVASLLDTLMHDSNVNVRLATIDALERYASRDDVRRGTIQAVDHQASPLVQIALIDFMVKTNERGSVPTLKRLAMDPQVDTTVRSRAQWGLQQLG